MWSFQTEHYDYDISDSLYKSEMPETIAVVSDLHNHVFKSRNTPLYDAIAKAHPDAVFITGDLVTNAKKKNKRAFYFIRSLSKLHIPVFYAPGNHEAKFEKQNPVWYSKYEAFIKRYGVHYLRNEWFRYSEHISIGGLELPLDFYRKGYFRKKPTEADFLNCLPQRPEGFRILLAHNPMYFPLYEQCGADLVLSGHVHGGIVRLPFIGGLVAPQFRLFPKYDAGKYQIRNSEMFVSRGLGTHTIPLRLWNKPELMIIHFKKEQ